MPREPHKFSEDERDKCLAQLLDAICDGQVQSVKWTAELMAFREAILQLAAHCQVDSAQLSRWIEERVKHHHHALLAAWEEKHPEHAALLDQRKLEDL